MDLEVFGQSLVVQLDDLIAPDVSSEACPLTPIYPSSPAELFTNQVWNENILNLLNIFNSLFLALGECSCKQI